MDREPKFDELCNTADALTRKTENLCLSLRIALDAGTEEARQACVGLLQDALEILPELHRLVTRLLGVTIERDELVKRVDA